MKKIFITILSLLLISAVGCVNLDDYVEVEKYESLENEYSSLEEDIKSIEAESETLKEEADTLEDELNLSEEENGKYQELIGNLNDLLDNVYYVYGKNTYSDYYTEVWGTGFSLKYNNKYYLITAGHIVDGEWGIHKNLGFKNRNGNWIYPELLVYEKSKKNWNYDYAIFFSNDIKKGLVSDNNEDKPKYILGNYQLNLNTIKKFKEKSFIGESGSPILDYEGELVGINSTDNGMFYTDIDLVLNAINNL